MQYLSSGRVTSKLERIETFFARDVGQFQERLTELDAEIDPDAEPIRHDRYHRRLADAFVESQFACRLFEWENGDDPTLIRDAQAGFRQETASWFDRSWIAHRSRTKPSGFAGDFEMLIKLYEEATPARGLGGYLDLCILDLPLARAVRARLTAAREFLLYETARRSGTTRVLDLACGPCREYTNWPGVTNGNLEIVAMDNDPHALAWVDAHVVPALPSNTRLLATRYNVLRTRSADATKRKFGRFDILYSVGLFDYLPDDQLIPILGALRDTLNEGGVMYIAFKDTTRYDKTPYQWHLDWFFYQRTLENCLRLYEQAGFDINALEITRDDTGIILNFVSGGAGPRIDRTDLPQSVVARVRKHFPVVPRAATNE